MYQDRVVFRSQHKVGRTRAADITELCDLAPVLYDRHETGDAAVGGTVHHFVYDVGLSQTIMRQSGLFVIYHNGDGALCHQC